MKYGAGGSLFQIAVAAIEITILINNTRNVPINAFLAFPKMVDIANDSAMAVFIHTRSKMQIGPGFIETISRRNAAATRRKMNMDRVAEIRKSI